MLPLSHPGLALQTWRKNGTLEANSSRVSPSRHLNDQTKVVIGERLEGNLAERTDSARMRPILQTTFKIGEVHQEKSFPGPIHQRWVEVQVLEREAQWKDHRVSSQDERIDAVLTTASGTSGPPPRRKLDLLPKTSAPADGTTSIGSPKSGEATPASATSTKPNPFGAAK